MAKGKKARITQETCDLANKLLDSGAKMTIVAKALGIGYSTLWTIRKAEFDREKYGELCREGNNSNIKEKPAISPQKSQTNNSIQLQLVEIKGLLRQIEENTRSKKGWLK